MKSLLKNSYKRRCCIMIFLSLVLIFMIEYTYYSHEETMDIGRKIGSSSEITQTYTYVENYQVPCQYVYDEELYEDETYVSQESQAGSKSVTVMSVFCDGDVVEKKVVDMEVTKEAVPQIVHIGTKERPEYVLPVTGYVVTSCFGSRWGRNHNGIDLAVDSGTPVVASAKGIVIQAGWNDSYGISVYIEHENGTVTRYAHLSEASVSVGQAVEQNQIIGLSGSTGRSTGPHLHFEIRVDENPVNPSEYLDF